MHGGLSGLACSVVEGLTIRGTRIVICMAILMCLGVYLLVGLSAYFTFFEDGEWKENIVYCSCCCCSQLFALPTHMYMHSFSCGNFPLLGISMIAPIPLLAKGDILDNYIDGDTLVNVARVGIIFVVVVSFPLVHYGARHHLERYNSPICFRVYINVSVQVYGRFRGCDRQF